MRDAVRVVVHQHVSRRLGAHLGFMAECGRPVTALPLTVRRFDDGVPGTRTVTLARVDGAMLPSFTPGSHIVIECGRTVTGTIVTA